jgi:hypothetical protein
MPSALITTLRSNLPVEDEPPAGLGESDQRNLLHALAAAPDPPRPAWCAVPVDQPARGGGVRSTRRGRHVGRDRGLDRPGPGRSVALGVHGGNSGGQHGMAVPDPPGRPDPAGGADRVARGPQQRVNASRITAVAGCHRRGRQGSPRRPAARRAAGPRRPTFRRPRWWPTAGRSVSSSEHEPAKILTRVPHNRWLSAPPCPPLPARAAISRSATGNSDKNKTF